MLNSVLIANRGEIACRIMRTARRLGLRTIAVASEADAKALHAQLADETIVIGPAPATESYLDIEKVMSAVRQSGAEAVHPGYGFLAENADFAQACIDAGVKFVGPSPDAMRRMGGKAEAKAIAEAAGVPVVPGYSGADQDVDTLSAEAERIGFPLLIKAVAGGGGRGMRVVSAADEFKTALEGAQREATASFGNGQVLLERLIVAPRHIEVQVFGDSQGNVVHLFERDCTLQRRHQKVIEEAPAPGMSEPLRQKMTDAAIAVCKAVGYEGAGTVEFLVEGGGLEVDAGWYFIEMNTRLQVEHPVTELITGLDLVEWQLRIAAGEPLPLSQQQISCTGHAVEARLYAEDPASGFLPSTGELVAFEEPNLEGVRVDSGVRAGDTITPFYDPMISKIICNGPDRQTAFTQCCQALAETLIAGPRTNAAFLHALLCDRDVRAVEMDTGLIDRKLDGLALSGAQPGAISAAVLALLADQTAGTGTGSHSTGPWDRADAFQFSGVRTLRLPFVVDGAAMDIDVTWKSSGADVSFPEGMAHTGSTDGAQSTKVIVDNGCAYAVCDMRQTVVSWPQFDAAGESGDGGDDNIVAPITGRVAQVFVEAAQAIAKGDRIAIVEAMKMEHVLTAPRDGTVAAIDAREGEQLTEGMVVVRLEAEAAE